MAEIQIKSKAYWKYLKDARAYTVNAQANIWDAQQTDNEDQRYSLTIAINELHDAIIAVEDALKELSHASK